MFGLTPPTLKCSDNMTKTHHLTQIIDYVCNNQPTTIRFVHIEITQKIKKWITIL